MNAARSQALHCLCRSPSRQQSLQAVVELQAVEHRILQGLALLAFCPASKWSTKKVEMTPAAAQQLSSLGSSIICKMEKGAEMRLWY